MESQNSYAVMIIEYCEAWHRLSLRTIERVGQAPDSAAPLSPFVQLFRRVFKNAKRRVSDHRVERIRPLRLQPLQAVRVINRVKCVAIALAHFFFLRNGSIISPSASCRSIRRALSFEPFSMALAYCFEASLVLAVGLSSR